MFRSLFYILMVVAAFPVLISADDGHSKHGEAFNEGPRQAAVLMQGTGNISFPITTKNPDAQKFFTQGVGQQHGFWYFEAERSFRQASALDRDAAMPYWGMAMANINNEKRAKEFIKKAVERKAGASRREQMWIGVLEKFYSEAKDDKRDKKQRAQDYISGLEEIVHEFPKDVEAKAFLAWKLWDARDLVPISSYEAVDALLDKVFQMDPMHPSHHYRIHLWDQKKPIRALSSDAFCGQSAPGIAHMWHMPGHTFSKLGRFDDAAWQQEAATRVDHAYMIRSLVLPDQIHNYAHNEEWLVRTYNELGRAKDGIALAKALIANPRHPKYNTLDKAASSASYGRTRLIETLLKWGFWEELLQLNGGPMLSPVPQTAHEVTRLRAAGVAAFYLKRSDVLADALSKLEALKETAAPLPAKEEIRKAEPKSEKKVDAPKTDAAKPAEPKKKGQTDREKAIALLKVLQLITSSAKPEVIRHELEKQKDQMPKEWLTDCWLRIGDKAKAAETAGKLPQDLAGFIQQAEVYTVTDKLDEAKKAFEKVRERSYAMDADLPAVKSLDLLAPKLGVTGAWKKPAPARTDSGKRPELSSLGPVHWTPPMAPQWEGMTKEGKVLSNKDFSGKPVVLVFYLGSTCSHCMEQLNIMEKDIGEFQKRGLPVLAFSPEPHGIVERAQKYAKTKGGFPFPLLAARDKEVFRAFRSWDDFEDLPLHAIAIVDGQGRLRWLDVSFEPFMDVKFVAQEAERLLKSS